MQPDHRPFLLPTELRTAEDVAEWLRKQSGWARLDCVRDRLDERLDRERRQACRRATFVNLPELARLQRKRKFAVERLWDYAVEDIDSLRRAHVDRALAFRAAARAR